MNIEKLSIQAEVDGHGYFVLVPKDKKDLILKMLAGFSKDGKLQLLRAPDDYKFEEIDLRNFKQ